MKHSKIVGGSTAKRVMNCPGSVALVDKMPPKPSSDHADRGTLLHNAMPLILEGARPASVIGMTYERQVLTQQLFDEKIVPALVALDKIDPDKQMEMAVESEVNFADLLPGVFGSADVLGRIGNRGIVLDWKFGDGVIVEAQENEQMMFYAAAAMLTEGTEWVFNGVEEVELIIVQPPEVRRWVTTPARIRQFERELILAVTLSKAPDAPVEMGDWCKWCPAKPICPAQTGAVARALQSKIDALDISDQMAALPQLKEWIASVEELALQLLEEQKEIPGYKLVAKRATRKWVDEVQCRLKLSEMGVNLEDVSELKSPAQVEKVLKSKLPDDMIVSVSTGNTIAPESDPRQAVLLTGRLKDALNKLKV